MSDTAAIALAAAATMAIFRFRAGGIPVLLACAGAGVAYRLMLA